MNRLLGLGGVAGKLAAMVHGRVHRRSVAFRHSAPLLVAFLVGQLALSGWAVDARGTMRVELRAVAATGGATALPASDVEIVASPDDEAPKPTEIRYVADAAALIDASHDVVVPHHARSHTSRRRVATPDDPDPH